MKLAAAEVHEDGEVARDDDVRVRLTPTELALLRFLAEHPDRPLDRATLLKAVWGYRDGVKSRALDTTIKTLRRKVEADPGQPDHIHTVRGVGYRFEPARAAVAPLRLFGRDAPWRSLHAHLDAGTRRIGLHGPGGIGKTRLARELVAERGGLWVDLTAARTADDVVSAFARALTTGLVDVDAVVSAVARLKVPLWVLDNCEGCVEALAPVVTALAAAAPGSCFVATSRVPLGWEDVRIELEPLDEAAAVALLAAHGTARRPGFADSDPADLARIVAAVDRVPLALELVAARAGLLDAAALAERLASLDWLGTLTDTIQWSWDLLDPLSRRVLAACSVFSGSFTPAAAEAVAGVPDALAALQTLQEASLVALQDGPVPRLYLLEMVRGFAAGRLEDAEAARQRHAAWLIANLKATGLDALLPEADNLAACAEALEASSPAVACRVANLLERARASTGPVSARVAAADLAVRTAEAAGDRHQAITSRIARTQARQLAGLPGVDDDIAASLAHAEALQDARMHGHVLGIRGITAFGRGDLRGAEADLRASLALLEQADDRQGCADRHGNLGLVLGQQGRHAESLEELREALALQEAMHNDVNAAKVMGNMAATFLRLSDHKRARRWFEASLRRHEGAEHAPGVMRQVANLALVDQALGRLDDAAAGLARAVVLAREQQEPWMEGLAEMHRGAVALEAGDDVVAEQRFLRARALLQRAGAALDLARLRVWEALAAVEAGERDRGARLIAEAIEGLTRGGDTTARANALAFRAAAFGTPGSPGDDAEAFVSACEAVGAARSPVDGARALDALRAVDVGLDPQRRVMQRILTV